MRKVFISCVSSQFKDLRIRLAANSQEEFRVSIQEDFEATASPYGTLVKIYEHLKAINLVVHIVGAAPSALIPRSQFDELLRHDRELRRWLSQNGLLASALAGKLGYGHIEAYLAIYLKIPLVPVFFGNGTQAEHVQRLRRMGRHIELTILSLDELPKIISGALARLHDSSASERNKLYVRDRRTRVLAWSLTLSTMLSMSIVTHLQVTVWRANNPLPLSESIALWLVLVASYYLVELAAMSSELTFEFRTATVVRTGTIFYFVVSLVAYLCAALDNALWYWPINVVGVTLLGMTTRFQTKCLEEELEYRRGLRKGSSSVRSELFYWIRRDDVFDALQVIDFDSEPT